MENTVLSLRMMKAKSAMVGKTLAQLNEEIGFGQGYIYRIGNKDTVTLKTVNRIAESLGCNAIDLLEDASTAVGGGDD